MIIDELLAFVRGKMASKRTSQTTRLSWRHMEIAIRKGKEGRIGIPPYYRNAKEEDICRWALNCALLHNGLSLHWMPLAPNATITEVRKGKKKPLPRAIHNWMMLASSNEWTRDYSNLMEGSWKGRT